MNENIELLRNNLENVILESNNLTDSKVIMLSQKLNKLIVKQQLFNIK
jgi:hypothetical protein